jgi:hypothetical protein
MIFFLSSLTLAGIANSTGTPKAVPTIAKAMPVFPEVASMTTLPSFMSPLSMASKNIERAGLSFTEPPGLKPSSLA